MKYKLEVTTVKLDDLELHPENVRQGDPDEIALSLQAHGQFRPLVVQKSSNRVLAGNHTLKAAHLLGWDSIDVTFIDVDDVQARQIMLVDNKLSDDAEYDNLALAELLTEIYEEIGDLEGTGFDEDDFAKLVEQLERQQAQSAGQKIASSMTGDDDDDDMPTKGVDTVHFRFGDYSGQTQRSTYDKFVERFNDDLADADSVMLDDILAAWLQ